MFITPPGETDVLMVVCALVLLLSVVGFGILFLTLHTLPERIAHKSHKLQFEIVAVLGLIALFTHMHIFWVIGLVLALVDFPDIGGWLGRIAGSVDRIAENQSAANAAASDEIRTGAKTSDGSSEAAFDHVPNIRRGESAASTRPELTTAATRG
jgi:multisubunit Na+/H+ antiporter MnhF subunit